MNWIVASILMFVGSVFAYTLVRKAQVGGIPNVTFSFYFYGIPWAIVTGIIILTGRSLALDWWTVLQILAAGLFFAYLGNYFSVQGTLQAPNPGYSLIISKSYVVFTSLVSLFLFQAPFEQGKFLAIGLIVAFSAIIVLAKNNSTTIHEKYRPTWIWHSLGAFFCWGMLALVTKHFIEIGVDVYVRLFYSLTSTCIAFVLEASLTKVSLFVKPKDLLLMILIGLGSAAFNIFMQFAYQSTPNPGYVNAVNAASIMPVTLLAIWLYKDEFNWIKLSGVIGVTIGLILLFL